MLVDVDQECGQKGNHNLQTGRWRHGRPDRLKRAKIHKFGNICDGYNQRHVGEKKSGGERIAEDRSALPRSRILCEVSPLNVKGFRWVLDNEVSVVLGDACQPYGYLSRCEVIEDDKSIVQVYSADFFGLGQHPLPLLLYLRPEILNDLGVIIDAVDIPPSTTNPSQPWAAPISICLVLLEHTVSFLQLVLGLFQLSHQMQEMRGVLRDMGNLNVLVAWNDPLEELTQFGVALEFFWNVVHHDGICAKVCHFPQPFVPKTEESPLRRKDVDLDHKDNTPHARSMNPIEPAVELNIAEGEIAKVIFTGSITAEGTIHWPDDKNHRNADRSEYPHHHIREFKHHSLI
mmetsp:Transcript_9683/g.24324  ORF Transcript_9683/g.24324 Transcript_9683/m.24324 type:complete len:345 (-) Transcript_9683:545-1579(-)